jgi:hypothetical protein
VKRIVFTHSRVSVASSFSDLQTTVGQLKSDSKDLDLRTLALLVQRRTKNAIIN